MIADFETINPLEDDDLLDEGSFSSPSIPTRETILDQALNIFHSTQKLHGLGLESQEILEQAVRYAQDTAPAPEK